MGQDSVSERGGIDLAQCAESCTTTFNVVVIADKGREEETGNASQDRDIDGPWLPDRYQDLLQISGYGLTQRGYHQQTRNNIADNKGEGDEVQHSTRDLGVFCIGPGRSG